MSKIIVPKKIIVEDKIYLNRRYILIFGIILGVMVTLYFIDSLVDFYNNRNIKNDAVWGDFNIDNNLIKIYPGHFDNTTTDSIDSFTSIDRTYFHEKCHYFWYRILNDTERIKYGNIFNNASYYVTTYGSSDVSEDFADTCSFYILDPNIKNKIDYERYFFLENHKNLLKTVELNYNNMLFNKTIVQFEGITYG